MGTENWRKPCDGTALDYRRHLYHGEEPCAASRHAERLARRRYKRSRAVTMSKVLRGTAPYRKKIKGKGVYIGNLPGSAGDSERLKPPPEAYHPNFPPPKELPEC